MAKIVGVKFKQTGKVYHFNPVDFDIKKGEKVVVDTARGLELGEVAQGIHTISDESLTAPLRDVVRIATPEDIKHHEENLAKEASAYGICLEKIKNHGLEMKLVNVEYAFDGSKVIFYFTADGRVDFRELVKDLATVFKTRIELRQIGVRDETKSIGSMGICGRSLCCSQFLEEFEPVSIKMAKEQGLSLNPTKISGACGRLMCCLKYEQDTYEELHKITPRQGAFVETPDGKGVIESVAMLKGMVKVRIDNDKDVALHDYAIDNIKVIKQPRPNQDKKNNDEIEKNS